MTKAEIAALAAAQGKELPPTWGKMTLDRAKKWLASAITTTNESLPLVAVTGSDHRDHTPGEVRFNPGWTRRQPGTQRGWFPVAKLADLPNPMTRQVARLIMRRTKKQPLGMSQTLWHQQQELGKVQPFLSSRRQSVHRTKGATDSHILRETKVGKSVVRYHATKGYRVRAA